MQTKRGHGIRVSPPPLKGWGTRRAFVLLEVVVAVGLLVLGMAVIGAQIQGASEMTWETDHLARIVMLAESRMAQLDSGLVIPNAEMSQESSTEIEIEEDFGRLFPQYASRVTLMPTATQDLVAVQLEIFYDHERMIRQHGDTLDDFDFDDERIVQTYHTLRVVPRPINLKTDFGLEDEIADKINEQITQSGTLDGAVDVENFDPAVFKDLSLEQLAELVGILQQAYNVDQQAILELVPEEMRSQLATVLQGLDAAGGEDDGGSGDETGAGEDGGNDDGGDAANDGGDDGGSRGGRGSGRRSGNPRRTTNRRDAQNAPGKNRAGGGGGG